MCNLPTSLLPLTKILTYVLCNSTFLTASFILIIQETEKDHNNPLLDIHMVVLQCHILRVLREINMIIQNILVVVNFMEITCQNIKDTPEVLFLLVAHIPVALVAIPCQEDLLQDHPTLILIHMDTNISLLLTATQIILLIMGVQVGIMIIEIILLHRHNKTIVATLQ